MDKQLATEIRNSFQNLFKSKEHQEQAFLEAEEYYSQNLDKLSNLKIKSQNYEEKQVKLENPNDTESSISSKNLY